MSDIRLDRDNPTSPDIDSSFDVLYEDMNDGSWAEVVYGGASGALSGSDILIAEGTPIDGAQLVTRYRDMGDGSYAEVIYKG